MELLRSGEARYLDGFHPPLPPPPTLFAFPYNRAGLWWHSSSRSQEVQAVYINMPSAREMPKYFNHG